MSYLNKDGLLLKFGTEKATAHRAGEYHFDGPTHSVEIKLSLADLTETETILDDVTMLPKGAIVQSAQVIGITSAATGTAIDVGLIKADRTTEYDYNGLIAALTTAEMAIGDTNIIVNDTATFGGAALGVALTETCYISASRTTATAFTAGLVHIRLEYFLSY